MDKSTVMEWNAMQYNGNVRNMTLDIELQRWSVIQSAMG